ncbi:MAG: DUF3800 domain-containing protein [Candidatus Competibacteraceae bacterium]|nr:DUF3800 domain-containing protein [Candidatus Competibacteraceae bacterium]
MNIFLDESGSFVSASKPDSWNSIAAYMSPECDRRYIEKILAGIRRSVGNIMTAEIKLKHLNELQYFKFLKQLASLNGVVFAVATDAGMNLPNDILEHQKIQAEKIIKHKEKMLHQTAREEGLQALSDQLNTLAPQLYVQLHCQINLMATIINNGVLYFVQRHPRSLGYFRWKIDQKNSTRTEYEKAFVSLTPALLQSISLRKPMLMLEGCDYSAFSRFDYSAEEKPTYLRDTYGVEINDDAATNIGMLIRENLKFVDSLNSHGVQIADLLASGIRRCLRQEFGDNEGAAELLGKLMVQNYRDHPPIQFLGFSKLEHKVDTGTARLSRIMENNSRPMLIS